MGDPSRRLQDGREGESDIHTSVLQPDGSFGSGCVPTPSAPGLWGNSPSPTATDLDRFL